MSINKNFPFTILVFFFFALISFSCSKDEEKPIAPEGQIIATADGSQWTSTTASAFVFNGKVTVIGQADDNSRIGVTVSATQAGTFDIPGNLTFPPSTALAMMRPVDVSIDNPFYFSSAVTEASTGKVVINAIDNANKTVSGSFNVKVFRPSPQGKTIDMKNGSFNKVPFTEQTGVVLANTFTVSINGSNIIPFFASGSSSGGGIILTFFTGLEKISLYMPQTISNGTFALGTMGSTYSADYGDGSGIYVSTSGPLVINNHDKVNKRIEGTFSFAGSKWPSGGGSVSITKGSFGITY